jgi:hypothetical protein
VDELEPEGSSFWATEYTPRIRLSVIFCIWLQYADLGNSSGASSDALAEFIQSFFGYALF